MNSAFDRILASLKQRCDNLRVRRQGFDRINGEYRHFFHDLETNTNFNLRELADLEKVLATHRRKFYKAKGETANA